MDTKTEMIKQVGGMLHAQQCILRVLKAGSYPAAVSGDVERGINYLQNLNAITEKQLAVMKKELTTTPTAELNNEN